ncbi:MAG: hypothetical protein COA42_11030 [Alteromonadaceae bacterium]|nr:MAG: hypothetical protein COA42_11030 [Alteromonadaceae bacterium]
MKIVSDSLFNPKKTLTALALTIGTISATVQAELDLSTYTCNPGEHLGNLPNSHQRVIALAYHNGYLIESVWRNGIFNVYDLADPRHPVRMQSLDFGWAGHHNYVGMGSTLAWNFAGHHQINLDDIPNLGFWSKVDFSNDAYMVPEFGVDGEQISYFPYGFGNVPHAYGYVQKNTITIHDQRLAGNPQIGHIDVLDQNGFEGRVNMIGNLLIVRGDNEAPHGVATYDISDPTNPKKLDSIRTTSWGADLGKAYDAMPVWGNYIILAQNGDTEGSGGGVRAVDIVDFSDPSDLKFVARKDYSGSIRYAQFKDQYMFLGEAKVDMSNPSFPQVATYDGAFGEYLLPVGNIMIGSGQDRQNTSRVFCNDAAPDTRAPTVAYHNPPANTTGLHVNGRVGVLVHETMDLNTLTSDNFIIRPVNGAAIPVDVSWMDNDTINITPKSPLDEDTTYEFLMPAGGIKDVAGNALAADFSFHFSTGNNIVLNTPPTIDSLVLDNPVTEINQINQLTVNASDVDGNPLEYFIHWGDDTTSGWVSNSTISHSYADSGIYTVVVQTRDTANTKAYNSLNILVEDGDAVQNIASSDIVYDHDNLRVLNVNPDNNTISAVHSETGVKLFEVAVPADPRSIAVAANGEIWVTSLDAAQVSVLSGSNGSLISRIDLHPGSTPIGIVLDPSGSHAYVSAMAEGQVYRIDMANRSIVDKLAVGPSPRAMALTADGNTLLVTRFVSAQDQAEVYHIDTAGFNNVTVIPLSIDSTSPDSNTTGRGIPNYLMAIAITPDGNTAWVGSKKDNVLRGLSRDGQSLNFQNTVRSNISFIDLSTNTEIPDSKFDIDDTELVSAIAFSKGGRVAYVTHQGNNLLSAYDAVSRQVIDRITTGLAPTGIAVNTSNGHVYTHDFLDRKSNHWNLFSGESNSLGGLRLVGLTDVVSSETLGSEVLLGKQVFYDASDTAISLDGYLSCAACHLDGGSDERVWDFTDRGEGLRNTISLRGRAGTGHGRVHWSANFDEIQDFEHDIRGSFGGTGLMDDADFEATSDTLGASKAGLSVELDALATYVTSLSAFATSPHRNADGSLTADAVAGKVIFESHNCTSCHGGAAYTDSPQGMRHDVGTISSNSGGRLGGNELNGIDTPTLLGIWNTAPYLHDGSAATLEDVLSNAGHGGTDILSASQRSQLAAYLSQLDGLAAAAPAVNAGVSISSLSNGDVISDETVSLTIGNTFSNVSEVVWVVDDQELARTSIAPYSHVWTPTDGPHRVYAMITYNNGNTTTLSSELSIVYNGLVPLDFTKVEAEDFTSQSGIQTESTSDSGGGLNIGFANPGDHMIYNISALPESGNYEFTFRTAGEGSGGSLSIQSADGNTTYGTFADAGGTGGWQSWQTRTHNVTLPEGLSSFRVELHSIAINLNWYTFSSDYDEDGVTGTADLCEDTAANAAVDIDGCAAEQLDADEDGVFGNSDQCPSTPTGLSVDINGCADMEKDGDGDGVNDDMDMCLNTPVNAGIDANGCELPDVDGDGIYDNVDQCLSTAPGATIDAVGCELPDTDNDGIYDINDSCAATPNGETADINGCSDTQKDDDGDLVNNAIDLCANTPSGATVDGLGCPSDSDGDSILDGIDVCAGTPAGASVDATGCPIDTDNDGIFDGLDACAATPAGAAVDATGCPLDADGDGIFDGIDTCGATAPGTVVDANGCGIDSDGDGIFDGIDVCASTPAGATVDSTGCPLDGDSDGVFDGLDSCPTTAANVVVDGTGCGIDSDSDGIFDGIDACANTPAGATVDSTGCPLDGDNDGVFDGLDVCPATTTNAVVDTSGCEILDYDVTFQAENYSAMSGVGTYYSGSNYVGSISEGDWMEYAAVTLPVAGSYALTYNQAGYGGGMVRFESNGSAIVSTGLGGTNFWENWSNTCEMVTLPAGSQVFKIVVANGSDFNINSFRLELDGSCGGSPANNILSSDGTMPHQGNFDTYIDPGTGNWVSYSNGEVWLSVNTAMPDSWQLQLVHDLSISDGVLYTICFDAKATGNRTAFFDIDNAGTPGYSSLMDDGWQTADLTTSYQSFKHSFVASSSDSSARMVINVGHNNADVRVDNIGVFVGGVCGNFQ